MSKKEIKKWRMIKDGAAYECEVPCSYYDILIANGLMEDPYYRDNEKYVEKMYSDGCRFDTSIHIDGEDISKRCQELVFEGLDTLCDIYLNGRLIGKTDNMHRTWRFDVKGLIFEGDNDISVRISSAVTYFKEQNRCHPIKGNGDTIPGFPHIRKAFYMSGWDWGPTLPDMGIWRPVHLDCYDARISDIELRQEHLSDGGVSVSCRVDIDGDGTERAEAVIVAPDGKEYGCDRLDGAFVCVIKEPKLWWPNGFGDQPLYEVKVKLISGGKEIDKATRHIGLRSLTVSQRPDVWGNEFCFEVNGIKIFAMGANYIPEENFLSRRSREKTEYLIKKCVEANFNIIRVWGGGIYPDDWFYELCDRYGLIVWQDMMFACNMIWLTDTMENTVIAELTDNIKRIRHHASLGLLCGNNENEEFMVSYMKKSPMELERADYLRLYCHLIPDICAKYAPDIFYWSSSPSSGTPFFETADDGKGDRHIWTVWSGLQDIDTYKTSFTRFCSEFGFESLPDMRTVESFTLPEDRNLFSEVMERHQKHKNGNGKLMYYIAKYYSYPTDFDTLIYATQLMQARAIRTAVEHFRRNRGRCMGAIYWQLNDCWPVASWSSIDYEGRPKAMYYAAKKFFAPVLLSANATQEKITLNVSNETRDAFEGTVVWRLKDTALDILWEKKKDICVSSLSAADIAVVELDEIPEQRMRDSFIEYELYSKDGELISSANCLPVRPKAFRYPEVNPDIRVRKIGDGRFELTLTLNVFARKVRVCSTDVAIGELGDSFFDITSKEPVSVEIVTENVNVTEKELSESLYILSEADLV